MTSFDASVVFFLELAVILATCRVAGHLVPPLGQPQASGAMIAGVLPLPGAAMSILVIMAIVTTLTAMPVFSRVCARNSTTAAVQPA